MIKEARILKSNRIIKVDLDDVMSNMIPTWVDVYNNEYDDTLDYLTIKDWQITNYTKKCTPKQMLEILDKPNFFRNVIPKPRTKFVLDRLRANGDRVVACSAYTHAKQLADKEYWLEAFMGIDRANTIFTTAKELVFADIMIDDRVENFIGFKGVRILFSACHNMDRTEGFDYRVNSWTEIEGILL